MKKVLSDLISKIENSYGGVQFIVTSVKKDAESDTWQVEVKEIPVEEDK